jgi:hypothetical protein
VLAAAIAVTGGYALVGCTAQEPPAPPAPDPLEPLIASATGHAALADSVAATHPPLAAAARRVAADRRAHAGALTAEVRRAIPAPATTSSPAGSGAASSGTIGSPAPADPAAARTALLRAASDAQRQAADLVGTLPRHRAGLVASVAACCASHAVVLG